MRAPSRCRKNCCATPAEPTALVVNADQTRAKGETADATKLHYFRFVKAASGGGDGEAAREALGNPSARGGRLQGQNRLSEYFLFPHF